MITLDKINLDIRFCNIVDEQRVMYGYTKKAIDETIRLCLERNILAPFLVSRQKEVTDIMITLFSQEKVSEIHDYNIAKDARAKGRNEERLTNLKMLMETLGLSAVQALDALRVADDERPALLELLS